jgi:hypothetical protein
MTRLAASVTASAATTTTLFARLGLVHSHGTTIVFLFVQSAYGRLSRDVIDHLHESETLAPARISVLNDLRTIHLPKRREQFLQI